MIHIDVQWFLSSCADIKSIISYITQSVLEELKEYYPEVLPNEVLTLADALSRIRNSTGQKFIVIIDEWDILIRDEATNKAVQEEYIYFLRGLFKVQSRQNTFSLHTSPAFCQSKRKNAVGLE